MGWYAVDRVMEKVELLESSPERVFEWLKCRAATNSGSPGDDLEQSLLDRHHALIDLGLARYGLEEKVLLGLFQREAVADSPVRLAVLSNTAAPRKFFLGYPEKIISENRELATVGNFSDLEILALFGNPELPDHFIRDFLEQGEIWQALDEPRRRTAVAGIGQSLVARGDYDDPWDGYAEYQYNASFDAMWQLASFLPATDTWAMVLGPIFQVLKPQSFSMESPVEVAERWLPDDLEKTAATNRSGFLSDKQMMRLGLARLALDKETKIGPDLLAHDDTAVRCAAYTQTKMSAKEVRGALHRDGRLAARYMMKNSLGIWRDWRSREALQKGCWEVTKGSSGDLSLPEDFRAQSTKLEDDHPDWFREDEETEDAYQPPSPEDPALSKLRNLETTLQRHQIMLYVILAGLLFLTLR